MDNINTKLHYFQRELIKKLSLHPFLTFNKLIINGLESEHMNYHLKKLIELKFVEKDKGFYKLTDKGKDYSNLTDEETNTIEKQPKTSVILRVKRKNKNGVIEHLMYKRLRQPYMGKVGAIGGKVKFGETLKKAAARELFEETGLTAKKFELEKVYHKVRTNSDGIFIQDVIFYIFLVTGVKGNLIEKTSYQENFWVTKKSIEVGNYDLYDDFHMDDALIVKPLTFFESVEKADGF